MNRRKITVGITGLNNIDSPGPGIPVIRALKDSLIYDVRIIGLSYESLEPGIYMHDLVDKSYSIPLPSAGSQALLSRIIYIHEIEKMDLIIPNFDAELHNFIILAPTLKQQYNIATFLPSREVFESRHKSELLEFGKKYDIKVPNDKMIFSIADFKKIEEEFEYPMVVKGKYYDASIAYNQEQVISYFYKISAKWGLPIIIQEYITGTEVNVTALGDGEGKCIGAVGMRKLYITDKGKAWSGITLDDSELVSLSQKVVEKSKWRGGCELEFIKNKKDEYYLLEMNPRFPAWVYLAVGSGQNHPEALVTMALGGSVVPFTHYDYGKMFIRYSYDLIVNMDEFEKISTLGEL